MVVGSSGERDMGADSATGGVGGAAQPWLDGLPSLAGASAVGAGASVAAYHALTPHLAHREQIYQFPNPFRVVLYGVGTDQEAARACLPGDYACVILDLALPDGDGQNDPCLLYTSDAADE